MSTVAGIILAIKIKQIQTSPLHVLISSWYIHAGTVVMATVLYSRLPCY
jgi:hypothetical protein